MQEILWLSQAISCNRLPLILMAGQLIRIVLALHSQHQVLL